MTRIYLFVPDGDYMTVDSVVVWLRVGSAKREQTKLSLLENYALDTGGFLRVRDEDSRFWLDQRAQELFKGSQVPSMHLHQAYMSIDQAYRMTIDGTLENYVRQKQFPKGTLQMLFHLDTNYMRRNQLKACNTTCPSGKRKYLSHSLGYSSLVVVSPLLLMVAVGLIDRLGMYIIDLLTK